MHDQMKHYLRQISLRQYLIIIMICIVLLVTGFLLTISYFQAEEVVLKLDEYFQEYTELNIRERVSLVEIGLTLYDSGLNGELKPAFEPYVQAYNLSGGNLSRIDYSGLQKMISRNVSGTVDLYVINRSGIIIRSTVPDVLYLNLSQNQDYFTKIPKLIDGSSFAGDRVVRSYSSADAENLTGTLRKFAFMPTPDHQFLLEIGVADRSFSDIRSNLSYDLISDEMSDINPYLDNIRVFDIHKNLFVKGGVIPPDALDPVTNAHLDEVISSRSDKTYYNNEKERVHYLFINQSNADSVSDMSVIVEVLYSGTLLQEEIGELVTFFSGIGLFAVLLGIILTLWASRVITRPIADIVEDVDLIAQGDLDHQIRSMKVREFARLEQSITLMIHRIRETSKEIERRKTELSIAAGIQRSFLPECIPDIAGFDIAAKNIPAKEVGGDFYDIIPYIHGEGGIRRFGVLIADVSGKGVPAALFMALCRTIIRITAKDETCTADVLAEANEIITADARSGMFVSLFYGLITEGGSAMTYVNAGHNPPVFFRARDQTAGLLHEGGMVLGVDDSVRFQEEVIDLHTGDVVVFYTDGITEAIDANTRMYGEERLSRVITEYADTSAAMIRDAILQDLSIFTGSCDQFDDITVLVIKKTNTGGSPGI